MSARVALIGCGAIGRAHALAVARLPDVVLVAVSDTDDKAAQHLAAASGAEVVAPHELADGNAVDLVIVATPPGSHLAVVEPLLRAGVAVLCEKPMEVDLACSRKLRAIVAETGTPFTVASKFRFVDDVARTRQLVREGAVGELIKVEVAFAGRVDMARRWNSDPQVSGGGVLIDNTPHAIDLVRHVAGRITEVFAVSGPIVQPIRVEDSATVFARTESGAVATMDVAWSYARAAPTYLTVLGSAGTIEVGWRGAHLVASDGTTESFGTGYRKEDALRGNLAAALQSLRGGTSEPLPTVDAALAAAAVIEAAYASLHSGSWMRVEDWA